MRKVLSLIGLLLVFTAKSQEEGVCNTLFTPNQSNGVTAKAVHEVKTVRINFHFVLKTDGSGNFNESNDGDGRSFTGYDMAREFVSIMNLMCNTNSPLNIPMGNSIPVWDKNYKFVLDAVYFIRNTNFYNYSSGWNVHYQYGKDNSSVINIYLQHNETNGGGMASESLRAHRTQAFWRKYKEFYELGFHLPNHKESESLLHLHELGHVFSLDHTVSYNDGVPCPDNCFGLLDEECGDDCLDTPTAKEIMQANNCTQHPHCGWNMYNAPYCSNNLMDYTNGRSLTPCQITNIHTALETDLKNYLSCTAVKTNLAITTFGYPKTSYFGKVITVGNTTTESKLSLGQKVEMYFSESVDFENFTVRDDSPLDIYYEAPCNY